MSRLISRAYVGAPDLELLIEFAREAARARWPQSTYKRVGDVVWAMAAPAFNLSLNIRLWFDGSNLAAYAFFEPPMHAEFDIAPGLPLYDAVCDEILEWCAQRRRAIAQTGNEKIPKALAMLGYQGSVLTTALDSDAPRISLLERQGYTRTEGFDVLFQRSLDGPISAPRLERSLRLRHATDADLEARVDVHRDAWSVWGPSGATVEGYRRLRNSPIYDEELDVILEGPDSRFLAYCIGWLDVANRFGHFEPVGCRPDCTRRGYARAVTVEGMRRMQMRGIRTALVATASVNQPARALYASCGFIEVDRAHHYTKGVAI